MSASFLEWILNILQWPTPCSSELSGSLPLNDGPGLASNNSLPPGSPGPEFDGPLTDPAYYPCQCSTVFYSLNCACSYCQKIYYIEWVFMSSAECLFLTCFPLVSWSDYSKGCSNIYIEEWATINYYAHTTFFLMTFSFPYNIPSSIEVPRYAYMDVVVRYVPTPFNRMFI